MSNNATLKTETAISSLMDLDQRLELAPIYEQFMKAVAINPEKICFDFLGRKQSYAEILIEVNHIAHALEHHYRLKKGDRVVFLLPNTPYYICCYLAVLKLGGVVVNANPLYSIGELEHILADSKADIVITVDLKAIYEKAKILVDKGVFSHIILCPFIKTLPLVKALLFKIFKNKDLAIPDGSSNWSENIQILPELIKATQQQFKLSIPTEEREKVTLDDLALLQYTGGTTGQPKGAMLSHRNIAANAAQIAAAAPDYFNTGARVLAVLPFFHIFAMTVCFVAPLIRGGQIIALPRFELKSLLKTIKRTKPTILPGVPSLYHTIAKSSETAKFNLHSIRLCISGGAALPLETKKAFEQMTGAYLCEGYGLTEASPVLTCNPVDGGARDGTIGISLPETELSIRDLEDADREVNDGERGELCAKGPQIMMGYWQNKNATAEAFLGDYLRTGDVAIKEEGGFYRIVDRIKDIIIVNGYNVYPRMIEDALYKHPAIEEVTVVGVKHPKHGEVPKAFIKLKTAAHEALSGDEIRVFLKDHLASYEIPRDYEFRDELPKTLIGKLSKKELKQ